MTDWEGTQASSFYYYWRRRGDIWGDAPGRGSNRDRLLPNASLKWFSTADAFGLPPDDMQQTRGVALHKMCIDCIVAV